MAWGAVGEGDCAAKGWRSWKRKRVVIGNITIKSLIEVQQGLGNLPERAEDVGATDTRGGVGITSLGWAVGGGEVIMTDFGVGDAVGDGVGAHT